MKRKLGFILLLILALAITVAVIVFRRYQSERQSVEVKTPFSRLDQTHELTAQLEKSGVSLETAPLVLGDTIEASVSGFRVLFAADASLETQIRALQLVLSRLKMDGKTKSEIDLRFNKIIIR